MLCLPESRKFVCLQVYVNIFISASIWIDNSQLFVTGLNLTTQPESLSKSTVGPYYSKIGVLWTPDLLPFMTIYIKKCQ